MEQVLIGKNAAYAAKTGGGTAANPAELAAGAIGVFTDSGELMTSTSTNYADRKTFVIAVGTGVSITHTPPLQRTGVYDVRASAYVAPVKGVATVTLTNAVFVQRDNTTTAAPTYYNVNNGDELIVRVVDNAIGNIAPRTQSYSAVVRLGDTMTTLTAKLVNAINIDSDAVVTATSNAAVLTLTGKKFGGFSLAIDGVANNGGVIAYPTQAYPGCGTADEVSAFERLSQASTQAVMEQAGGRGAVPVTLQTAVGETYDQFYISAVNHHHQKDAMDARFGRFLPIRIAIPAAAAAVKTELEAVLGQLIDYTPATAPELGTDAPA